MNVRQPLEALGKWHRYEEAVAAGDWPAVKALLREAGCSSSEMQSILWSLHAPGTETEVETTSDRIIGRVGTILIAAIVLGCLFAWAALGFGNRNYWRHRAATDYRPWKQVVGVSFAAGAIIGGGLGAAYFFGLPLRRK
jgi:hypothetical protein